ncbi:hypothetical protein YC2023_016800 [Brassica napus]
MEFVLVDRRIISEVQKKENYVNVLANEEKFKLEWMKNNMFSRGPESARDPECCSICHFIQLKLMKYQSQEKLKEPTYERKA